MKILIVEDNDFRIALFKAYFDPLDHKVWYEKTSAGAIDVLTENADMDLIFLDHDLGDEVFVDSKREDTGAGVARWMVSSGFNPDVSVTVHSLNPAGSSNILHILRSGRFAFAHAIPFTQLANMLRNRTLLA